MNVTILLGLSALFVGVAAAIVLAGQIIRERSEISASLNAISSISPASSVPTQVPEKPFKDRVTDPVRQWAAGIARSVSGGDWSRNTAGTLDRAGNPAGWDAERILSSKTLVALVLASVVSGTLLVSGRFMPALVWGAVFGALGFFIPDMLLRHAARTRSEEMLRTLPDSIDLLTISVESGLSFDAAIAQVARNTRGPLAEEFTRVLGEIQIGGGPRAALGGLAERTDVDDLRVSLNALIQAETFGIPVADVLRAQSAEIRLKRSQRIEEQAMKLPVKMVFPVMFCIMPALFIVVLGPAILNIIDQLGS